MANQITSPSLLTTPDTTFDSTVRFRPAPRTIRLGVPPAPAPAAQPVSALQVPSAVAPAAQVQSPLQAPAIQPAAPTLGAARPVNPPAAVQPGVVAPPATPPAVTPPPTPAITPPATPPPPLGVLPTTASPTTTTAAPDTAAVDKLLNDLESFGNLKIDPNWRQMAATDPDGLIAKVQDELNQTYLQYPNGSQKNMMVVDDKLRQRLNDWMAKFSAAVKQTSTSPNPDFQRQQTENQLFANAQGRLTQQLGYTGRSDEQNLMAMLASKGLLNSGLAQRELARLEMSRTSNYNDTLSNLSQAILAGDLTHLNQTDLAQLESALSTKNQEYLMRLQAQLEKDSQPSGWAQIAGAAVPALIGLLSPKAPTQLQQSPAIYGGQNPMNSYPYTDQYGNPVTN